MDDKNIGLMLSIAMALKPLADTADEYDRQNTYRPDRPQETIVDTITLQHCFNAQRLLKELHS